MNTTTTTVQIIETGGAAELFHQYPNEFEPQPCYIELDLRAEDLHASYDAVDMTPFSVAHGFDRRYSIPILTCSAANELMQRIAPLADRILADWEKHWDGNNMIVILGEDAAAAEEEIEALCEAAYGEEGDPDLVAIWDTNGSTNGDEVSQYGITADTSDERLQQIADEITEDLRTCTIPADEPEEVTARRVAVTPGLLEYLEGLRDEQDNDDEDD